MLKFSTFAFRRSLPNLSFSSGMGDFDPWGPSHSNKQSPAVRHKRLLAFDVPRTKHNQIQAAPEFSLHRQILKIHIISKFCLASIQGRLLGVQLMSKQNASSVLQLDKTPKAWLLCHFSKSCKPYPG